MKKVIIIGAGIAGLTCGIYLQKNGFETEILELHTVPGGECTGWDRGEFHFDGCIHWLVGSKPGTTLHGLWRDTGAIDDSVRFVNHEIFLRYEAGGRFVNLYTNADKLEQHLLEISPQDKKEIKAFCKAIHAVGDFGMPIDKPMDMMTLKDGLKFGLRYGGKLAKISRYNKMSMAEFAGLFSEPLLRAAFLAAIPGGFSATSLLFTLAGMNAGDSGYPLGGSRAFARRMEQKYLNLGGKVCYRSKVDEVVVQDGKSTGVRLKDGTEKHADYVVSCADGYATLYHMLGNRYTPELYKKLFENPDKYPTVTCTLVYLGLNCELKDAYYSLSIKRDKPVKLNGLETEAASLMSYNHDRTMAPEGKTVFCCFYEADYDYWNKLYADREKYREEKQKLIEDAKAVLAARYPEAEGKVATADCVTPKTYERYCNAWRGSWMTWHQGKDTLRYHSGELPGLANFLMAGMWTLPPGGLPGAAMAGRYAAHRLCIKEGKTFKN